MKKLHRLFILLLGFTLPLSVHAEETRYVSDELSAYIRSGPSIQNRIIGSLSSGEEVILLSSKSENGFFQVKDHKGRTSWILASELSAIPSLRERLPAMDQKIKTLTENLANIDDTWNKRTAELQNKVATSDKIINDLKKENAQLQSKLTIAEKKVEAANLQLDDKQREIILQWFTYGGGVAGIGLILGLVLPHIIPRRKKKDRWMS
ncbi:TIGR04211 family SH3 domain-containing protein [Xenorhabdus miraniensis]|uniref:Chromosome partition protein Smc n=1 Tax=Xenorhabdus miraniensis TaxID=351674 RepID=A0A2D0JRG7_9GAMM|nr:TIGR04211 family SH3 domain-containing protein [Xenorhabdus miraniensis]PHM48593.1 Chromosome partition protein Smc [Xenorhabdus miraniensis]PHM48926.1 Chromosome partition protein Smc [Xenorhabdus miraniensis]